MKVLMGEPERFGPGIVSDDRMMKERRVGETGPETRERLQQEDREVYAAGTVQSPVWTDPILAEFPKGQEDLQINEDDPMARQWKENMEEEDRKVQRFMSPKGVLGLPPLLDERRLEYGIPDGAFLCQAFAERVRIWQVAQYTEKYGDTSIVMPDIVKSRERHSCNLGILLSAGPGSMDCLHTQGIELGHIVEFVKMQPWRSRVQTIAGHEHHVMIMNAGDILGSLDLARNIRKGTTRIYWHLEDLEHKVETIEGTYRPKNPWTPEDT